MMHDVFNTVSWELKGIHLQKPLSPDVSKYHYSKTSLPEKVKN